MNFLIDAWDFNQHPAQAINNDDTVKSRPGCWFHFQRDVEGLNEWLKAADIPEPIIDAMLEEDTRPRFQRLKDGFVLLLRGVNLNEGAQPEDMMSLRILYYKDTVYTFRKHHFKAVAHIRDDLQNQQGPESLNDFLVHLVEQLNQKIEDVIDDIELNVEQMETEGFDNTAEQQKKLTVMHRRLLRLNRFIRPQLAALDKFTSESEKWVDAELHQWLLNERDTTQRLLEQIDLMLEQVWMQREQIQQAVAEKMNRNTYWLSVIAGVFLPLSFLTGVFGINIGGMPGVENTSAFEIFCWILLGIAVVEFLLLRRLRFW
ncbi:MULTISPECIES: zinc transporter ZntB [unclassified Idiomarina]|uniref:zinc transporter ZntB n=1 Tax=unclassified Idiomarina TaxID=2614829 RepID=UPI000C974E1D|nr:MULTISPECIES: zinc transporter ZntB [unclassified Idiomarina]MAD54778.1 zinc transporter ZntB [Idiomarinaceae bacterium]MEC7644090.1 zinc transporter ZntB [Pseudomonadota bacterium]MEC9318938.1 zinc transporter ZntB [Pseudomonadota bacterium]NQZ03637.1 zinc transporter ZntB [Idiomarina sp.]|tara:strand:+ start:2747 stop:3694 length:948 start_codon:yes stop_codon:yes gene_type:complete